MGRSLPRSHRASNEGIKKAKTAFQLKGWTQDHLAGRAGCTRQVVSKFLARGRVEKRLFEAICNELGLEWGAVADLEAEEEQLSGSSMDAAQQKTSESIQEPSGTTQVLPDEKRYGFAIAGSVTQDDITKFKAIAALLKDLAKDTSIKIIDIESGSIKLILEGSSEGLEQLEALFKLGELKEVLGIPVEDVKFVAAETSNTNKKRLAFTIAGNVTEVDIAKLKAALTETSDDEDKTESDKKSRIVQEIITQGAIGRNLSNANLSGAILSGAILSRADLSGADLSGGNLSGATLRNAILSGADLSGANLSGATLRNANLSGATLRNANLSLANLSLARSFANLSPPVVILSGVGASLSGAILSRADLSGANLSRADLSGANLSHADLSGADLSRANLSRANLSRAILSGANLSRAILSGTNLSRAILSDANLSGANLSNAILEDAIVVNALFGGSVGLSKDMKRDLERRGAIFGDRPEVPTST